MSLQQSTGVKTDYVGMLRSMIPSNPEGALNAAKSLCQKDPNVNVHQIAELFLQNNRVQEMTAFLVECMKANRQEDSQWQTKALELNLMGAPHVAEAILQMGIWNQYDRQKVANLCEQKGNLQRALENYTDLKDIKRVVLNTHMINHEWLA
jgi:clathrin heavy chain